MACQICNQPEGFCICDNDSGYMCVHCGNEEITIRQMQLRQCPQCAEMRRYHETKREEKNARRRELYAAKKKRERAEAKRVERARLERNAKRRAAYAARRKGK